jgi:UDP-2,4-diacetamido-2,4,6-trideoxy-beta-L-altropyranose hydrolase
MNALLIRADAGGRLGSGHIMRMIGLCQAWISKGGQATIATIRCPEELVGRMEAEGILHNRLNTRDIASEADATETVSLARRIACEWVVLDGYGFDFSYQRNIGESGLKVAIMDDYGHTYPWRADLIINPHPEIKKIVYENLCKSGNVLRGTDYVILRKEFWAVRNPMVQCDEVRKLLISMGGVDADNLTGSVLHALNEMILEPLELRVIVGPGNPHLEDLKTSFKTGHHAIEYCINVKDMTAMYEWADAVVTAAGGTVWEWLLYGHHGGIVVAAENQAGLADWLIAGNLASTIGHLKDGKPWIDKIALSAWLDARSLGRREIGGKAYDGRGAIRVVEWMLGH